MQHPYVVPFCSLSLSLCVCLCLSVSLQLEVPPGISLRSILREASFYCVDIPPSAVRQSRTKHLFIQESWDSAKTQFTLFIRGNIDLSLVQELERYFTSIEVPETAKGRGNGCDVR